MIYTKEYLKTTPMGIMLGEDEKLNNFALNELGRITNFKFRGGEYPNMKLLPYDIAKTIGVYFYNGINDGTICYGKKISSFGDYYISVEEFLNNIEPDFVIGEWYECICDGDRWLFKYLETKNNKIYHSICYVPRNGFVEREEGYIDDYENISNIKKLTNMEEVYKKFPGEKTKKIIGYKSPFKMVGSTDCIEKGDIFSKTENEYFYTNNGVVKKKNPLPKEIVEQWEPVYEEDEIIKIGGYEVIFVKDILTNTTMIDGNQFTLKFWEAAKLISSHSKAKIMVGCSKQFDVSLEIINKIIGRLEK